MRKRWSHVIGFDDGAFDRKHRGDVLLVGAVFANLRLEGVLAGKVRRDGRNATETIVGLIRRSRFVGHLHAVLLQGVAVAGFNVIDLHRVHAELELPVIAVARKPPNYTAIRRALLDKVPGGQRKWQLIERLGPMESVASVYVQRIGIGLRDVESMLARFSVHGFLPEPIRVAHIIASGITQGESRHRP